MISAEQAHQIADELVAQEHACSVARRNATARRIPRIFQCAELQPLPAWQRRAVVDVPDRYKTPWLQMPGDL